MEVSAYEAADNLLYGYCMQNNQTKAEVLACFNNAAALVPPFGSNCPPYISQDEVHIIMAMVCRYENDYWTIYSQYIHSFIEEVTDGDIPIISNPETRSLLNSARKIKDKRTTPTLQSSTAHDLKNRSTHLSWSDDGNLVASTTGNTFSSWNGYFIGDTNNHLLHMYSDTMASLGVSRLRLASLDAMPVGSVLVYVSPTLFSLLPFLFLFPTRPKTSLLYMHNADITPLNSALAPLTIPAAPYPILIAFTSAGDFFYIVTCIIEDQLPKLFLVQNLSEGIAALMDPAQQSTVTGGVVDMCGWLRWSV
jgi:hypothetical protein